MAILIPPTGPYVPPKRSERAYQAKPVYSLERNKQQRAKSGNVPFVERRGKPDRRASRDAKRAVYDMRSNRGRRRTDRGGQPSVEIRV